MRSKMPYLPLILVLVLLSIGGASSPPKLIGKAKAFPSPFTPNGDGKNDLLFLSISLGSSIILPIYPEGGRIRISVSVMDLKWRVLTSTFDGSLSPGSYEIKVWDGKDKEGRDVPRGIYILRIEARSPERRDVVYIPVSLAR